MPSVSCPRIGPSYRAGQADSFLPGNGPKLSTRDVSKSGTDFIRAVNGEEQMAD